MSGFSHSALAKSVLISPGAMQLTRTLARPELGGEVARELEIRRLGDVVGADHRRGLVSPPIELTMMIEPSLRSSISGATIEISQ